MREADAVTDNPLVFDDWMVSGGNFHAEPVALAADGLALAIAEVGAIAERRIAMLIDPGISRLPPFLTADAGLHSGFMIAHVTAAALASGVTAISRTVSGLILKRFPGTEAQGYPPAAWRMPRTSRRWVTRQRLRS